MTTRKSNVKIENGKVVFSNEILEYFKSIRTEENSEWIDKYFEVLSDSSNIIATKFEVHHIIPIFTFRDEIHKNRKEIENLADEVKENLIKLSISNHVKAHNYLRLMFKNTIYEGYAKSAVYIVCRKKNVENFTENEINEIAKIIEDCVKENKTKEDRKEWFKIWYSKNRDRLLINGKKYGEQNKEKRSANGKRWYNENKERHKAWQKEWEKNHKDERRVYQQEWRKNHRNERRECDNKRNAKLCLDPIKHDKCTFGALYSRVKRNKTLYININPRDCIIKCPQLSEITIFDL